VLGAAPAFPALAEPSSPGQGWIVFAAKRGGGVSAFAGSYSPDGRSIVCRLQNDRAGTSSVWTMRPGGSHRREMFHRDGLHARGIDWGGRSGGRR
jgi:hypothetical protein